MNNIVDSINHIIQIIKKEKLNEIIIIIAAEWKFDLMLKLLSLVEESKDQGEIIGKLMENKDFKTKGKFISQTVIKVLKNLGKYVKSPINAIYEFNFFFDYL